MYNIHPISLYGVCYTLSMNPNATWRVSFLYDEEHINLAHTSSAQSPQCVAMTSFTNRLLRVLLAGSLAAWLADPSSHKTSAFHTGHLHPLTDKAKEPQSLWRGDWNIKDAYTDTDTHTNTTDKTDTHTPPPDCLSETQTLHCHLGHDRGNDGHENPFTPVEKSLVLPQRERSESLNIKYNIYHSPETWCSWVRFLAWSLADSSY